VGVLTCVTSLAVIVMSVAGAGPERVLVLDVDGDAISPTEAGLVRDALAAQLQRNRGKRVEVLTSEDLRRVLDVEADKQATGCDTTMDSCLAEIANALGASRVLHGSVARLDDELVLSVALVDPKNARALGRSSVRAETIGELVERAPDAVDDLRPPDKPPVLTVAGAVVAGLGLVVGGVSGVSLGVLANAAQDPRGDPELKQAFLDNAVPLGIGVAVGTGVILVGVTVLCIGIVVE
jgi:hypothetical protein